MIRPQRRGTGAVSEQPQLMLLDPVLHLSARAVELLVQALSAGALKQQIRHHEARIGALGQILRLADHSMPARPGFARAIVKVAVAARGLARALMPYTGDQRRTTMQFRSFPFRSAF